MYDTESNLTDIYDAKNNHTTFAWSYNRLYQTTFPSGYYESYSWDYTGQNLTSKTDRNGSSTYYSYDPQDRLFQWAGYLTGSYDPAGRLTGVSSSYDGSSWGFAYDNMGRLTQTTTNYGFDNAGAYVVRYGYDAASNRASMTDPQNGVTTYTYDTLNRLSNLQDPQSHNFGFSYDVDGWPTRPARRARAKKDTEVQASGCRWYFLGMTVSLEDQKENISVAFRAVMGGWPTLLNGLVLLAPPNRGCPSIRVKALSRA